MAGERDHLGKSAIHFRAEVEGLFVPAMRRLSINSAFTYQRILWNDSSLPTNGDDALKILTLSLCCLLAAELTSIGQMGAPNLGWDDIRKSQPAGLQLRMTLPKTHFYQGEIINATLEFSNTGT